MPQRIIIKQIIKERKITQKELARRIGVEETVFSRMLNKRENGLGVNTLLKIADVLCVDVREFFSEPPSFTSCFKPISQWAGSKNRELETIMVHMPQMIENYYEPFVGGGSIYLNTKAKKFYINDLSNELIALYENIATQNNIFLSILQDFSYQWKNFDNKFLSDITELYNSIPEGLKYGLEIFENIIDKDRFPFANETAVKSVLYVYYRHLYNHREKLGIPQHIHSALFVIMKHYSFNGLSRFNSKGQFSVPYGGSTYDKRDSVGELVKRYQASELINKLRVTIFSNSDFEGFLSKYEFTENDFIFLEPPYDTAFSAYDKNDFGKDDHRRLEGFIRNCKAKCMLVINNNAFVRSLYENKRYTIKYYSKKYTISIKSRNAKAQQVEHMIITNY